MRKFRWPPQLSARLYSCEIRLDAVGENGTCICVVVHSSIDYGLPGRRAPSCAITLDGTMIANDDQQRDPMHLQSAGLDARAVVFEEVTPD